MSKGGRGWGGVGLWFFGGWWVFLGVFFLVCCGGVCCVFLGLGGGGGGGFLGLGDAFWGEERPNACLYLNLWKASQEEKRKKKRELAS